MSLFQCEVCGCVENTACSAQGFAMMADCFDWSGMQERKAKLLCSACGPGKYADGTPSGFGVWHGRFPRRFLPKGMFRRASNGNLEHIETHSQDISQFASLQQPEQE